MLKIFFSSVFLPFFLPQVKKKKCTQKGTFFKNFKSGTSKIKIMLMPVCTELSKKLSLNCPAKSS